MQTRQCTISTINTDKSQNKINNEKNWRAVFLSFCHDYLFVNFPFCILRLIGPSCVKFVKDLCCHPCFTLLFSIRDKLLQFEITATQWRKAKISHQNRGLPEPCKILGTAGQMSEWICRVLPTFQHLMYTGQQATERAWTLEVKNWKERKE